MAKCMDCGEEIVPEDFPERYRETARTTGKRCVRCVCLRAWELLEGLNDEEE